MTDKKNKTGSDQKSYDVIIIGSGPGGYVAAIRAAQLGMSVVLIEKYETLGGTCLNVGCIPSKALLESSERYHMVNHNLKNHGILVKNIGLDLGIMMERKDKVVEKLTSGVAQLIDTNGITRIPGTASLVLTNKKEPPVVRIIHEGQVQEIQGKHVVVATGSRAIELPGFEFDGDTILSSTHALALSKVPKKLVVIGAGAIGLEMASVWARLGSEVQIIELAPQILPGWEPSLAKGLQKELEKLGIEFLLGNKARVVKKTKSAITLELDKPDPEPTITADKVLVAVGRKAYIQGLGLENLGVSPDDRGRLITDSRFRVYTDHTAEDPVPGLYAIGDVISGPMLAHKAEDEGVALAEILAGQAGHVNYDCIPGVVYTWPEAAMAGLTEQVLKDQGIPYKKGSFNLGANGRALAMDYAVGNITILAHGETDRILGVHMWGPWVSDLIAEVVGVMELMGSAEDLGRIIHAHPTLPEGIKEAALAVHGQAIHGVNRKSRK